MARTSWSLAPYNQSNDWLMQNGAILPSPAVETTSSQRRWRIAGAAHSVQKHELPDRIRDYMLTEARRLGTDIWMQLADTDTHDSIACDLSHRPEVSFDNRDQMPIRFDFVHPTFPLRVVLWIRLHVTSYGQTVVSSEISYRDGDPMTPQSHRLSRFSKKHGWANVPGHAASQPPPEIDFPLDNVNFGANPRKAASYFLELLHLAQDVDTVTIPDGRNPGVDTLTFEFSDTNYTQDFYRAVLDVVQGGPAMERLAAHLAGIKQELRNLGLVANDADGFDVKALLNGRISDLRVQITPQDTDNGNESDRQRGLDRFHSVTLDLAHNVFAVKCNRGHLEEAAEQWNIAKFKAEISGEEDVLATFVAMHNDAQTQKRLRKIINERQVTAPTP